MQRPVEVSIFFSPLKRVMYKEGQHLMWEDRQSSHYKLHDQYPFSDVVLSATECYSGSPTKIAILSADAERHFFL